MYLPHRWLLFIVLKILGNYNTMLLHFLPYLGCSDHADKVLGMCVLSRGTRDKLSQTTKKGMYVLGDQIRGVSLMHSNKLELHSTIFS
jgi:hypothetical protein